MRGVMQRRFVGVAITGMVVAGIVGVTSLSASGQSPPESTDPAPLVPYGTLTINLNDRSGSYTLVRSDGVVVSPETIVTGAPCATVQPGSGQLLRLTPNPASSTSASDTVQLRNSAIGVNTGNTSCGTSNAAVISRNEQLRIELGDALPEGASIKSASLQVKKLRSGDLRYALDDGPLTPLPGITISQSPQQILVAPTIKTDDDLFTSITLQSTSTKDNEGLSIFNGTSFELVAPSEFEFAVDCGEQVTKFGGDGDIAKTAVFFRGENGAPKEGFSEDCVDIGVIVEIQKEGPEVTEDRVFWDNSVRGVDGSLQAVNGTVTIEWAPIPPAFANVPTQIDFDGPGVGDDFVDAPWCLSFSFVETTANEVTKVTFTAQQPLYSGAAANADGTAPWCLVSSVQTLDGDGNVDRVETFFGSGDPTTKTTRR